MSAVKLMIFAGKNSFFLHVLRTLSVDDEFSEGSAPREIIGALYFKT